jgi:hypothetical protein
MGGLTRKRTQKRIVKKTRRPGAKPKVNLNNLNPTMQS